MLSFSLLLHIWGCQYFKTAQKSTPFHGKLCLRFFPMGTLSVVWLSTTDGRSLMCVFNGECSDHFRAKIRKLSFKRKRFLVKLHPEIFVSITV